MTRGLIGHLLPALVILAGCAQAQRNETRGAMDAAPAVSRADEGKGLRDPRVIPLKAMSGDVELLYGDPDVPGKPFVMRIHELPGSKIPPHSHPVDENITVLQGTWYFGFGETFDPSRLQELEAGAYAFAPAGSSMFGASPGESIVQVHGIGPFSIQWHGGFHSLDDADAATTFTLRKGAVVETPLGTGRIVQGYASGSIVQYEVEASDGHHFMADQAATRPR